MILNQSTTVLKVQVRLRARTPLAIGSGQGDIYADNILDKTPEGDLHINGYVWASLMRRAMGRVRGHDHLAAGIGKYPAGQVGLSPLWTEATFVPLPATPIRPGNRMSRKWKAVETGAEFSEEITPVGLTLNAQFNVFCFNPANAVCWREALLDTWWVIHQGVETIGGGWSYGFGRLDVESIAFKTLDLFQKPDRGLLWQFDAIQWDETVPAADLHGRNPALQHPWLRFTIPAAIQAGQLMAIRDNSPPPDKTLYARPNDVLPDTFVYRNAYIETDGSLTYKPTATGKALRQALFAREIERCLRASGPWPARCHRADAPPALRPGEKDPCACDYCRWFGNTARRGMLSIGDAPILKDQPIVLFRGQLCEHSHQNIQLFSGEFLKQGHFDFDVIIDYDPADKAAAQRLAAHLAWLITEMAPGAQAPPGWHRIGGTSSATGQLTLRPPAPDVTQLMEQIA